MPTRAAAPKGPDLQIYTRRDYGDLASFHVLDTRQYRTDEPCAPDTDLGAVCDAARGTDMTMMGTKQEQWLDDGLNESAATWTVIAQQVIFSQLALTPGAEGLRNLDQWDGYPARAPASSRCCNATRSRTPSSSPATSTRAA